MTSSFQEDGRLLSLCLTSKCEQVTCFVAGEGGRERGGGIQQHSLFVCLLSSLRCETEAFQLCLYYSAYLFYFPGPFAIALVKAHLQYYLSAFNSRSLFQLKRLVFFKPGTIYLTACSVNQVDFFKKNLRLLSQHCLLRYVRGTKKKKENNNSKKDSRAMSRSQVDEVQPSIIAKRKACVDPRYGLVR